MITFKATGTVLIKATILIHVQYNITWPFQEHFRILFTIMTKVDILQHIGEIETLDYVQTIADDDSVRKSYKHLSKNTFWEDLRTYF